MDLTSLGKYEIRAVLGRGGMGVVYEGWDPRIARRVAIKTVRLPDAADDEAQEEIARFRREAQAAGRLNHPSIVGVFDYGETDELAYIVMEFVAGRTLKAVLDAEERLPLRETLRIMRDVLAGLEYSHANGIVHRDIKPGNIILTDDGRAKITDFGIARIESSSITQAGTVLGTPAYMSPEQFMGQPVDARTDIYSAGVLLYQLLTGERPFDGRLTAIMHKALNTRPPRPSDLSVTAPPELDAVVDRAMARRPEDRYPSAAAFAQALAGAAEPASAGGSSPHDTDDATLVAAPRGAGPAMPAGEPARRAGGTVRAGSGVPGAAPPAGGSGTVPVARSRLPAIVAAAGAVLVLLGGGAWFAIRPAPSPEATPSQASTGTGTEAQPAAGGAAQTAPQAGSAPANLPSPSKSAAAPPASTGSARPPVSSAQAGGAGSSAPQSASQVPAQAAPAAGSAPTQDSAAGTPAPSGASRPTAEAGQQPAPGPPVGPLPGPATASGAAPSAGAGPAAADAAGAVPPASRHDGSATDQSPAGPGTAAQEGAAPREPDSGAGSRLALNASPAELRAALAAGVQAVPCAFVGGDIAEPSGTVTLTGLAGPSGIAGLREALGAADPGAAVDWRVASFDDPTFCQALDLLRPIAATRFGAPPRLSLGLEGDRARLADGDPIVLRMTLPDYESTLQADYLQNDGTVAHMTPSKDYPARSYGPRARATLGEPVPRRAGYAGFPGYVAGAPYGTDMILVVASSRRLFAQPRPETEPVASYLRDLAAALETAQRQGTRVTGAAMLVQTAQRGR